ncbi:MAG: SOS response-associated peptidase [Eubacteriaceae bacterium]|jgi:putative SOS response-associated peptidase YedK|nr:SOS response-associated peptidase [Eubacteriaceae bacterium]
MCGRYYFGDADSYPDISWAIEKLKGESFATGEIFPTNNCAVLAVSNSAIEPAVMKWGFKGFSGSRPIINARCESVASKPTFAGPFRASRCIVPMSSFYEWDAGKKRYEFLGSPPNALYAAGICQLSPGEEIMRFCILTTSANASVSAIHSRMPLLLPKSLAIEYAYSYEKAISALGYEPSELMCRA